jgi:Short C-terminal domain
MLLVPKQLRRAGMTGNVPYYGGRFSPAQAYAASHPTAPPPSFADPMTAGGAFVRAPVPSTGEPPVPGSPPGNQTDAESALQQLLDSGLISQAEFQQLRSRVTR